MSVHIGSGLAIGGDPREAAVEAALQARDGLGGAPRGPRGRVRHRRAPRSSPRRRSRACTRRSTRAALVGCGAAGVLGGRREVEGGTAVSVWAASLDDGVGRDVPRRRPSRRRRHRVDGMPDLAGAAGAILLPDPWSLPDRPRPARAGRAGAGRAGPRRRRQRARRPDGGGACFPRRGRRRPSGAVGVRLDGVELLPCVSQGATPLGPELTVTAADGPGHRGARRAAGAEKLREVILELPDRRARAARRAGCCSGSSIDGGKPEYVQGDFLVRGLVGADPDDGLDRRRRRRRGPARSCALHARDADSADRDLREALELRREALGGARAGGRARLHLQRPRARRCSASRPRRRGDRRRARRRPGRGVLRGGRDRAGRRRELPARLHRDRGGLPAT